MQTKQPEDHSSALKKVIKTLTSNETRDRMKRAAFRAYCVLPPRRWEGGVAKAGPGVNLIGHIRGSFGLGESCRLVAAALDRAQVPMGVYDLPLNGPACEDDMSWAAREGQGCPFGVNLIHLNPNEIANAVWKMDRTILRNRYNIAFWLWELSEFPPEWDYTFQLFDEIWTPAEFISQAIRKRTTLPVFTMPYGIEVPPVEPGCGRSAFGLPQDTFLFLLSYDGNSVSARKNPQAVLRAYREAFSPSDGDVGLVIKATHAGKVELAQLREMFAGYPNLVILTDSYSKPVFNSLLACVDVYVSLHRAEGFGLVMAESMLLGTPVIGTNWSANTEFMSEKTACMVDAQIIALPRDYPPYHKGDHWAQPDEHQAAQWMRRLYTDRAFAAELAQRAKLDLTQRLDVFQAGQCMKARLETIFCGAGGAR
ncbi:glycosyltransferase family 4 protein [Oscillibacter ruminantium]